MIHFIGSLHTSNLLNFNFLRDIRKVDIIESFKFKSESDAKKLADANLLNEKLQLELNKARLQKPVSNNPTPFANSEINTQSKTRIKLSKDIKEKGYSVVEQHLLDTAAIILSGVSPKNEGRRKKEFFINTIHDLRIRNVQPLIILHLNVP